MFLKISSILGATGVFMGAFGAHRLKNILSTDPEATKKLQNWNTAAHYQMLHSVILYACASTRFYAPALFTLGICLFSGSIYCLTLTKDVNLKKILGPVTPIGGLALIAGWLCLLT